MFELNNRRVILLAVVSVMSLLVVGCAGPEPEPEVASEPSWPEVAGYEMMAVPADNPLSVEKVALGQQLYYDARLSGDGVRSCYGCHLEEHGLTDGKPLAIGAFDKTLTRSSPTMWNVGYYPQLYWDGRRFRITGVRGGFLIRNHERLNRIESLP